MSDLLPGNNKFLNKNIILQETKHCFFLKKIFSPQVTAGFTKTSLFGQLPADFNVLRLYVGKKINFSHMVQKHSRQIVLAEKPGVFISDGIFTKQKNHFLVVKTADCLPIFLTDNYSYVGVIHVGWKSAKKRILENIPFDLSESKVFAGPGLRSCCYQVGQEFKQYPIFSGCLKKKKQNIFFDPIKFVKNALILQGLKESNFFDSGLCSCCAKNNFFSYRRDKTDHRTLSFIGLKSS
ncbi:MAG: polyphenol oxidase family protein [Candidatus Omnitrophica bacterium]|nr:polyphenol oxidase family protein [Candidatus Omnitrophota bacterium]